MKLEKSEISNILNIGDDFVFLTVHDSKTTGRWILTGNENFFRDHFLGDPMLPASILQESMLQTGVISLYSLNLILPQEKAIIFSTNLRIYKSAGVVPIEINVSNISIKRSIAQLNVSASQSDKLLANASFKYKITKPN